jgi:hypothetical protein
MIGQFKCGCIVSAQFKGEPPAGFFDRPCPNCDRPRPDAKWAAIDSDLKRRRQDAFKAAHKIGASEWRLRETYSMHGIARAAGIRASQLCSMERGEMDPAPLVEYWAQMTEVHHGPFAIKRTPEGLELHLFCDRPPIAYAQTELNLWRQGAEKMAQMLAENWEGQDG